MSHASSRHNRSLPFPLGRVHTGDVSSRAQAGDAISTPRKMRRSKQTRAIVHNNEIELNCFLPCPFASTMDLTEIKEFWRSFGNKQLFRALCGLLMVLFEIVHEWLHKETDQGKEMGMGMNSRSAILWHLAEFLSDAHITRSRTSLRRKLRHAGLQSIYSSLDSQQTRRQQKRTYAPQTMLVQV